MRSSFYDSAQYRKKQSAITKRNQEKGVYEHLKRQMTRTCARKGCVNTFLVQLHSPKRYCSRSCAAVVNSPKRKSSDITRQKISQARKGSVSPQKGIIKVPRVSAVCSNPACEKIFSYERYQARQFCSVACAMKVTGGRPTSPKASRGKAGIRTDIHPSLYFYSRWEANMARLYTYLGIQWVFTPKSFDIGGQMYTPDFYLPETDTYIEVKNFWGEYSKMRDTKFRRRYKDIVLQVILKEEYLKLEEQYAHFIPHWEYKNSTFTLQSKTDKKETKTLSR